MKINQVLVESAGATVAFAFGRFNPAHQGHIEVWRAVEDAGANWFIGTNPSTLGPNDPLTFQQKSAWMEEIYPAIAGHIIAEQSVLTLAAYIFKKTRKNENATVAYITDAADWAWSGKLLNQYNGVEGAHGYYKFAQITHVPSPRVSSATALRDAARADDKVAFYHASGTDPKSKVAGLTYFDTVKQACEKYPLPVKRGQKVKEAPDANFVGFMNKAMNTRQDNKPLVYDPKTVMSMDTMPGYKKAFKFGMDVIKKMDPDTKQEFANAPDDTLFSYMMNIAEKKGYAPEQFMSEDLDEVTSEFEEIFHDPDMEGWTWTDLLRDMIGMEPRALSKANVQAHKKEFSHAQQMAAKGPGPIDPSKLKAVTRSDTKQTEIWYPINPNYEAGGWVVVATGFQNKEQAEQKLTQMQQDPSVNKQIQAALNKNKNESVQQGVAEDNLKEFAPGNGGGESGRWYTDDQITDLVGDGWWNDLDISGEVSKQEMIQEAQAWLDDQGYSVQVLNCKVNDDDMEWYIEGSFHNSGFAKKGIAEEEQKTVAKTWDQMTAQEKSSGVKGRTVWNEKTKKYYTVFDVPATVKEDVDLSKYPIKVYQNKMSGKFIAWVDIKNGDKIFPNVTADTAEEATQGQIDQIEAKVSFKSEPTTGYSLTGLNKYFIKGMLGKRDDNPFWVQLKDKTLFVSEKPVDGFIKFDFDRRQKNHTGAFTANIPNSRLNSAGMEPGTRYNVSPLDISGDIKSYKFDYHSRMEGTWDKLREPIPILGVQKTGRSREVESIEEDEEAGEVEKTGQLIPFPAGTTKVSVSDVYDWYKLGQVISDLDDANPADFGQGAPETIIAFGSEEEENKLLPLLQRLGLKLKDIDQPVSEAYHAGSLYEMLKKERTKNWSLTNKKIQ